MHQDGPTGTLKPLFAAVCKVMHHLFFYPMVQWQKNCCQRDHKGKVFPRLALCDGANAFLEDEEQEFEEHKEREEAY